MIAVGTTLRIEEIVNILMLKYGRIKGKNVSSVDEHDNLVFK